MAEKYQRVRDNDTGHEYDVLVSQVDPKHQTVLDDYPLSYAPRRPKHRISKGGGPAKGKPKPRSSRGPKTPVDTNNPPQLGTNQGE